MSFAPPPPAVVMGGGAVAPPAVAQRPLQLLLTNVPPFLHGPRPLRSWLQAGGGGVRSAVLIPPPPPPSSSSSNSNPAEQESGTNSAVPPLPSVTALVTMSHADAALKVLTAFRHFQQKMRQAAAAGGGDENNGDDNNNEYAKFAVHAVPGNPDIPLPPAVMDRETVRVLGDQLYDAFQQFQHQGQQEDAIRGTTTAAAAAAATGSANNSNTATAATTNNENKSAATTANTTGNLQGAAARDDGDEDPLESPAIQEAVRNFRAQLQRQQGTKATRRQQLVREALQRALPVVRGRARQERAGAAKAGTAPPLPVGGPPPPPGAAGAADLPPPPPPAGPRGVSNQPAWMTQQQQEQQQQPSEATAPEPPPAKKIKLDLSSDAAALAFPAVPPDSSAALRGAIADRVRHYLGQEEDDLIDFVHARVVLQEPTSSVAALQSDLADVLERDAPAFVQAVYETCAELARGT